MLVFSPALADCLETILEISEENQEIFLENGGERLDLVPALNDSEDWAKCVVKIIQDYICLGSCNWRTSFQRNS